MKRQLNRKRKFNNIENEVEIIDKVKSLKIGHYKRNFQSSIKFIICELDKLIKQLNAKMNNNCNELIVV